MLSTLQEDTLLDSTGRTSAWCENFVNEVVVLEECSNCQILKVNNHLKRSSVDAEHLFHFHVWTQNICSVFALKAAFSNLSGIV